MERIPKLEEISGAASISILQTLNIPAFSSAMAWT